MPGCVPNMKGKLPVARQAASSNAPRQAPGDDAVPYSQYVRQKATVAQLENHVAELEAKLTAKPRSARASPGFHSPASAAPIGERVRASLGSPGTEGAAGLALEPEQPQQKSKC